MAHQHSLGTDAFVERSVDGVIREDDAGDVRHALHRRDEHGADTGLVQQGGLEDGEVGLESQICCPDSREILGMIWVKMTGQGHRAGANLDRGVSAG